MCRRNHGAAYVTWFGAPRSQLSIEMGRARTTRYQSSPHGSRTFCGACGTSLFCVSTEHPDVVDIPLAVMDGPIDKDPQVHIYFDDRARWAVLGDTLPRLGGTTGLEPTR
jgi:hypothetical protein